MNLAIDTPNRQAALLLRSLGDSDREWVLSSLSSAEQTTLRGLLRELKELGIPEEGGSFAALTSSGDVADDRNSAAETYGEPASTVRHGASSPDPKVRTPAPPVNTDALDTGASRSDADGVTAKLERLTPLEVEILARLLSNESAGLVVRLLAMHDWVWRDTFLAQLSAIQRKRVEDLSVLWRKQIQRDGSFDQLNESQEGSGQVCYALNTAMACTLLEAVSQMRAKITSKSPAEDDLKASNKQAYWRQATRGLVRWVVSSRGPGK